MDDKAALARWFDDVYVDARRDSVGIPWARMAPHPEVVAWFERRPVPAGTAALVVASGLGDDAEYLAAHGLEVTGFDVSEAALAWCRERYPDSVVNYRVADLFHLPAEWRLAFDLVVEVFTIQSVTLEHRDEAIDAIAATVAPGGTLGVVALARPDDQKPSGPPWPVSRRELGRFEHAGLQEVEFYQSGWQYVVEYRRAGNRARTGDVT